MRRIPYVRAHRLMPSRATSDRSRLPADAPRPTPPRRGLLLAAATSATLLAGAALLLDCAAPRPPRIPAEEAPRGSETTASEELSRLGDGAIPYDDEWRSTGFAGRYIAPKTLPDTDTFDVIFHFHAGRFAEKEYREHAGGAVLVTLNYGAGTTPYSRAFADPARFQRMLDEMVGLMRARTGRSALALRRISLVAWSAGYASIGRILAQGYYDRVDTVVLLDGLHANYADKIPKRGRRRAAPPAGPRTVDARALEVFARFAADAAAGKKSFVFTHSSIVPPGYASTTETAASLIATVKAARVDESIAGPRNLRCYYHADAGDFHVRGFTGGTKDAHIAHVHMVGDVLRDFIAPRWARIDRAPNPLGTETATAGSAVH